ncbi:MAG TPA: FAD-dependent oxidoreductase, partial [Acidobacteriaceae bacterium]
MNAGGKTVVVVGGGVGGLSAAHELAERGFQVKVYERKAQFGGKARSMESPGTGKGGRKDLPGEHGYRFFPNFYKHVTDTMKRIPYPGNAQGVYDNIVTGSRTQIARGGKMSVFAVSRYPQNLEDWIAALKFVIGSANLGIPELEELYYIDRLLALLTSCEERRVKEYEQIPWWEFVDAANKSAAYQQYLVRGTTRSLVALKPELGSTRTVGYVGLQLGLGLLKMGESVDRLLNGPTSEVWIDPWVTYLESIGVELYANAPTLGFVMKDGQVVGVSVQLEGMPQTVTADYYVAAMPVEAMAPLATAEMKQAAPSLANIDKLQTAWMNGIQFYLEKDVPVVNGHTIYIDSPWALTSISQRQFWRDGAMNRYGDGRLGGILSVDVSDWNTPGILYGKTARECSVEEIKSEVWAQIKAHLDVDGAQALEDANLLGYFLDNDIQFPNPSEATNAEPLLI